jgi:hypothetical protein
MILLHFLSRRGLMKMGAVLDRWSIHCNSYTMLRYRHISLRVENAYTLVAFAVRQQERKLYKVGLLIEKKSIAESMRNLKNLYDFF